MDGVRILDWLAPAVPVETVDWDAAYREEMPRVFNYFRYRGFERATAEDLTSATFEKAWRARDRYRKDRAAISTWLLAIARNTATDHLRRSRPVASLGETNVPDQRTPEQEALRGEDLRRLRGLVFELPGREQEILALKYGAGLISSDILPSLISCYDRIIGCWRARSDTIESPPAVWASTPVS